jgi:hypothetical protein
VSLGEFLENQKKQVVGIACNAAGRLLRRTSQIGDRYVLKK